MRLLFDVLGSPRESGGMRQHATQVVRTWAAEYPGDELIVLGPEWVGDDLDDVNISHVRWANERVIARASGQFVASSLLSRQHRVDALVSLSPIVSPFLRRTPTVCFQHDWRHLKNPQEFGLAQKLYRKFWASSAEWASLTICISDKTAMETRGVAPGSNIVVIENGRDHATSWERIEKPNDGIRRIVTFGHHNNKRPELVIEALPHVSASRVELTVLGASGSYREELSALARAAGVESAVRFPGFVSDGEYRGVMQRADVVVMASSDEGFGLPIVEAETLGIPAVVTSDSGMADIHDNVIVASPTPASLGAAVGQALVQQGVVGERGMYRWVDMVHQLRTHISEYVDAVL